MSAELDIAAGEADQIAALHAELDQRNATIEQLAEQLEDAANRLDWISRSGADPSAKPSEAGPQSTMSSQAPFHGETTQRLEQFLEQWEETALANSLERIDRRLSHVFELLKSTESDSPPPSRNATTAHPEPAADIPSGSLLTAFLMSQSQSDEGSGQPELQVEQIEADASHERDSSAASGKLANEIGPPLPDFKVPSAIEVETASIEELRDAVIARDECIQQLIVRSRVAEAHRTTAPDWKSLENAPDELRQRLMQLEDDLRQRIKQEELSSSIECAKLSRDRAHLDQVRREIESQIQQLGQTQNSDDDESANNSSGKRWGKLFGR